MLNIADDYFKAKENADQMEEQKDRMEKETYSLKHELGKHPDEVRWRGKDLEERQRQLQGVIFKTFKDRTELRAAKKQAAHWLWLFENEDEEVSRG